MLTFAGYTLIGAIAGSLLAIFVKDMRDLGEGFNPLIVVIAAAIIGIIQRTSSDKKTTWYRLEASIAGVIVGALIILMS